jgi:hypothetical protein
VLLPSVDIRELDGRHLAGWLTLLLPPGLGEPSYAALFLDGDQRLRHAVRAGQGALDPAAVPFAGTTPRDLAALRRALGVELVLVFAERGAARLHREIERQLRPGDDFPAQVLTLLRAVKRLAGDAFWLEPRLHDLIPPLSPDAAQRTFELLVPSPSSLCAYVFDDRAASVVASALAVVEGGHIARLTTHLALADSLPEPELARRWRSDIPRLLDCIDRRLALPSIGVFVERAAWQRIVTGPGNQLSQEMSAGHLVVNPAPPWLRGLLGGAQLAAAATGAMRSLSRFVPGPARRAASDLAQSAQERLRQTGAHPFALLGFDPIELWHQVRAHYRPRRGGA